MTNSIAAQDLADKLTLNKLKELIEPFRNNKILIGITCRPEFYDYLIESTEKFFDKNHFGGVEIYKVINQQEQVKYFYNNHELSEYLKNNV